MNASVLLQQVVAVAKDHVGVDVVDAGQQQVIRVYLIHKKIASTNTNVWISASSRTDGGLWDCQFDKFNNKSRASSK